MSRREALQRMAQMMDEGRQRHIAGDLVAAEAAFRDILTRDPNNPEAMHRLGMILGDRGDLFAAAHFMEKSLGLAPNVPEFHNNLGEVYRKLTRPTEAKECYQRALKLRPSYAEAHNNLALVLLDLAAADAAAQSATEAARLAPGIPEVQVTLGTALRARNRWDDAIAAYQRALRLRPNYELAVFGLASARASAGQNLEQISADLPPGLPRLAVLNAVGAGYLGAKRYDEAQLVFQEAIELDPDRFEILVNLANVYTAKQHLDKAEALLRRASAMGKDPGAALNLGMCLLSQGKYEEGWKGYEQRYRPNHPTDGGLARPVWRGEPCTEKTILLVQEQGFGDTIQFIRYAPLLAKRGARILAQVHAPLVELIGTVEGISQVLSDQPPRGFDAYCHMASLPMAFGTTVETVPAKVPYLAADPARVAKWRDRLSSSSRAFKVGLAWQGNPAHQNDRLRSIPLEMLSPLGQIPSVQLYSLQLNAGRGQIGGPGTPALIDLAGDLKSFADTAAALMSLDLVIAIDSAVIHLAGALARPVWSLHAFAADFRWMTKRPDSPWYPTMKLYRQPAGGDWPSVVARVAEDLAKVAAEATASPPA